MSLTRDRGAISGLVAAALFAGAQATAAQTEAAQALPASPPRVAAREAPLGDPFEATNRRIYGFDQSLDRNALRPLALEYVKVVPLGVRTGLRNAFANLGEPVVAVNDLLQFRIGVAGRTLVRFAVNSSFGVAGLFDVGARGGLPHHDNDFGLTLARAGVGPGPYLVLPVLGPSNVRDAVGLGLNVVVNPLTWVNYSGDTEVGVVGGVVTGLDARASADRDLVSVDAMATDPYATLRSLYLQNRQGQVTGGAVNVDDLPDFDGAGSAPAAAVPPPHG